MSDLAPFVAAALRDKVVSDLKEENNELRQRWQRYEIRSKDSPVVYAKGLLEQADVIFSGRIHMLLSKASPCPLRELSGVHVCVGGSHKTDLQEVFCTTSHSLATHHPYFPDTCTSKNIYLGKTQTALSLHLVIDGWPREHWSKDLDRVFSGIDFFNYLVQEVAPLYPGATVTFGTLSLHPKNEVGAVHNLPEPVRSNFLKKMENAEALANVI